MYNLSQIETSNVSGAGATWTAEETSIYKEYLKHADRIAVPRLLPHELSQWLKNRIDSGKLQWPPVPAPGAPAAQ